MKDCTTCKYGYEDERLGIPMCHHPKRFSEDCVDFNMHEESEKPMQDGLEKELDRFIASGKSVTVDDYGTYKVSYHDFKKVARHFAEWQKEQDEKKLSEKIASAYQLGLADKEKQMMKEAVEGEYDQYPAAIYLEVPIPRMNQGDKVRVIVCKKED